MKKHQCVLFDLDGVIVDTAKYHYQSWKKIANTFDYNLTHKDNEQLKGVSRTDSLKAILKMANINEESIDFEFLLIEKNQSYLTLVQSVTPLDVLPGIMTGLDFFKEKEVKIGLGSASKNAQIILEKLKITSYFEVVIDGNQVLKGKPDPEVFLKGSFALNIAPEYCLVFEDSAVGIKAAKAASMTAVALGEPSDFSGADFCYPDFSYIDKNILNKMV
jgi:beta-phosphoglucomutase